MKTIRKYYLINSKNTAFSINYEKEMPLSKKYVRGTNYPTGYAITPLKRFKQFLLIDYEKIFLFLIFL